MATQASWAIGTSVKIGATIVPELTNITDIGINSNLVDVTAHDSVGGYAARIPTFLDGGTYRATFNWVPSNATQTLLRTTLTGRTSTAFVITFPTVGNPTISFNAFVTRWIIPGAPVGAQLQLNVDFAVDGAPVFA
jgi:hypothetical protein